MTGRVAHNWCAFGMGATWGNKRTVGQLAKLYHPVPQKLQIASFHMIEYYLSINIHANFAVHKRLVNLMWGFADSRREEPG